MCLSNQLPARLHRDRELFLVLLPVSEVSKRQFVDYARVSCTL